MLKCWEEREILSVRDIMAIFGVDRETVYHWRKKGILPLTHVGGKLFAKREDIDKIIANVGKNDVEEQA